MNFLKRKASQKLSSAKSQMAQDPFYLVRDEIVESTEEAKVMTIV